VAPLAARSEQPLPRTRARPVASVPLLLLHPYLRGHLDTKKPYGDLSGATRVGTGRQGMAFERGTTATLSQRSCSPRYGLHYCQRDRASVAKRPRELVSHPNPSSYCMQAQSLSGANLEVALCIARPQQVGRLMRIHATRAAHLRMLHTGCQAPPPAQQRIHAQYCHHVTGDGLRVLSRPSLGSGVNLSTLSCLKRIERIGFGTGQRMAL
jgi:hypothetical protein